MRNLYLVVTPFFPSPENWRGPFIYDQVKALMHNGMNVVVFKPSLKRNEPSYEYDGITVHHFHVIETPSYIFNGLFNGYNAKSFRRKLKEVGIKYDDILAVHGHTTPFGIYGLALKQHDPEIKAIVQQHERDPYLILNGRLAGWKPNLCFRAHNSRRIIEQSDVNVVISDAVKDNLLAFPGAGSLEYYPPYLERLTQAKGIKGPKYSRVVKLYNGVDTSKFQKIPTAQHPGFTIGCIGNFQELKRQEDLIKAVGLLRDKGMTDIRAIFIGTGPTLDKCRQLVLDLKLSDMVDFRTEVKHDRLCEFYNSLDLFVLPTVFDGFGCVCTEAAACDVPFMICRGQGAGEYIPENERDLWLIEPYSPTDLAAKIERQYRERNTQHLKYPIDINVLVKGFLKEICLLP